MCACVRVCVCVCVWWWMEGGPSRCSFASTFALLSHLNRARPSAAVRMFYTRAQRLPLPSLSAGGMLFDLLRLVAQPTLAPCPHPRRQGGHARRCCEARRRTRFLPLTPSTNQATSRTTMWLHRWCARPNTLQRAVACAHARARKRRRAFDPRRNCSGVSCVACGTHCHGFQPAASLPHLASRLPAKH